MYAHVRSVGIDSDAFKVNVGVNQSGALVPNLFDIYLAAVTLPSRQNLQLVDGVCLRHRLDARVFTLRRLGIPSKTSTIKFFDL